MRIRETVNRIKNREISCSQLLEEQIPKIEKSQIKLNAYINLFFDRAKKRAEEFDSEISGARDPGPLTGIPVAVKDNMLLKDTPATCGSKILENYISPYTATAVARLEGAGAIIVGKTNMDEFAMGSSGENSAFGPVRNPHDTDRIPGGSSSGSAAAVADGAVLAALGSDTGGSIRQPAAMCGAVGMKPTYGLVSRYGLVAFASSLDQIGSITGSVQDACEILRVIAGHDPKDSTSLDAEIPDYISGLEDGVKGLRLGILDEYIAEGLQQSIKERILNTASELRKNGAEVKQVSLGLTKYAVSSYYIVAPAEASSNLSRYDGVKYGYRTPAAEDLIKEYSKTRREGFGPEVKRRIMLGTFALSSGYYEAYYLKAQKVRTLMKNDFEKIFRNVDLILAPATPTTAFRLGEKTEDPLSMYLSDVYTISANLAGIPAVSVPAGFDENGLPVGCQLMGPYLSEKKLLRAARQIEKIYEC
jgi:aspartyl-tRNA(Asn)/glutamyl-tRNA(Gln) amidotransferase subunit A